MNRHQIEIEAGAGLGDQPAQPLGQHDAGGPLEDQGEAGAKTADGGALKDLAQRQLAVPALDGEDPALKRPEIFNAQLPKGGIERVAHANAFPLDRAPSIDSVASSGQSRWAGRRVESPAGPLVLRAETAEDAEFRFKLFRQARAAECAALAATPMFDALLRQQFAAQNTAYAGADLLIVLSQAGARLGRLALQQAESLDIVDIALSPEARGKGIGAALILFLQRQARDAAVPLRLNVARGNWRAAALYRRLGFGECGGDAVYAAMVWTAPLTKD